TALQQRLELAAESFLQLGALGLRATRGLGSFVCQELPYDDALGEKLCACGFRLERRAIASEGVDGVAREIGALVKGTRKECGWKIDAKNGTAVPSPFGSSIKPRQTSAVHF